VPPETTSTSGHLLFPEKEAKSVVPLRGRFLGYPTLGEADPGGLGACPQQNSTSSHFLLYSTLSHLLLFQKKKQKALVLLRRRLMGYPNLGEADPGGLGACPQQKPTASKLIEPIDVITFFFSQKKKQKALVLHRRRLWAVPNPRRSRP
jgi:hypothetical protein